MSMLKVLIPLDGSSFSRLVLTSVQSFLKPKRHHLILMRVAPPPAGVSGIPPRMIPFDGLGLIPDYSSSSNLEQSQHPIYDTQAWESLKAELSRELNQAASSLQNEGFDVSLLVHFGDAAEEVIAATEQRGIDLIVMATHGRRGLERMLVGSVAEGVLRHVTVPVLMVRPERTEKARARPIEAISNVLVPLDETEFSHTVLEHVVRLLSPSEHHLTLLRVAVAPHGEAPVGSTPGVPGAWSVTTDYPELDEEARIRLEQERSSYYTRLIEDRKAELLEEMESARTLLAEAGFTVECTVRFGQAAEEIGDFATFNNVAMVVMATHSRAGLERLVLGSVAKEVLSRVHVPVMMVRPHLEGADETLPLLEPRLAKSSSI
jgi:nucleotide-binding universal stress UspA family protein